MSTKITNKRKKIQGRKRKHKFILGENEKKIILAIGISALVLGSLVFPNLPMALQPILKMRGRKCFSKLLKKLQDKGIIYLGGERVKLTKKGLKFQKQLKLEETILNKPKEWDGIWRLISYDIPNRLKQKRDWFRSILMRLGFLKIQESLWVYPFDCKEEIAIIAQDLGIASYVIVMITDNLPKEEEWENEFALEN